MSDTRDFVIIFLFVSSLRYNTYKYNKFSVKTQNNLTSEALNVPAYLDKGMKGSMNSEEFLELTQEEYLQCTQIEDTLTICPTNFIHSNHQYKTCGLQILLDYPTSLCKYQPLYFSNGIYTKRINQD